MVLCMAVIFKLCVRIESNCLLFKCVRIMESSRLARDPSRYNHRGSCRRCASSKSFNGAVAVLVAEVEFFGVRKYFNWLCVLMFNLIKLRVVNIEVVDNIA